MNQRDLLVQHDQEVQASIGVVLESAMNAANPHESLASFQQAVNVAQSLYGRNIDFDAFLRKLRKTPVTLETLQAEIEQFLVLLAGLSQY